LRLAEGLNYKEFEKRFNKNLDDRIKNKAEFFAKNNLVEIKENSFNLTRKGFLLSNSIIADILFD
ncbi:MAG: coproporphyrinogen III oxidase, partial [Ruminococcus sp.]|nr:coproporphyrinogen III oxidase [Candidatus Copronaster equi]